MKTNANQDQDDSLESSSSVASIGLSIAPSEIDSPASPSSSSSSSFRKLITNFKRINDDDASSVIDDDEDEDNNDDDDDDDDDDDNNIELRNYICLHLICSVHKTIFLCKNSKGVWSWPSKHFVSDLQPKSLRKHLREHLKELSSLSLLKGPLERYRADLLQIYRVRMIRYNQFCQRFLFKIILYQIEEKNQCFCSLNDPNDRANPNSSIDFIQSLSIRFKWFRLDEIRTKFIDEIWPGEIFVDSFDIDTDQSIKNFIELDTNRLREDIAQRFRSDQIESAIEFFNEYIILCYPSSSMTWCSFDMFCNKTNWFIEHDHRKQLFQSIDTKRKGSIDFLELLNGFILFNENRLQKNLKPSSFFEIFMKNSHNSRCSISRMENYSKILKQFHHKSNERCLKCLFRRSDETDHGVLRKKFHLSSVLIKLKESGSIRRLYQLRSNPQCSNGSIEFRDEIPKRNIFLLTNQMMKFLESIKSKHQSSDGHWSIFLQNNSIYCCLLLILEFANKLLANTESIVQIDSPGFIIGSMDACFKELVKLCKTLLPTVFVRNL
ncbi:salivary secreted ribonuclease [Sarcoptes scabiei]|nr:salivary secreted ribonuclease [Sarcoptes scabiei]